MRSGILLLLIVLLASSVSGAPIISGLSGDTNNGGIVTVTGSQFGSHTLELESTLGPNGWIETNPTGTGLHNVQNAPGWISNPGGTDSFDGSLVSDLLSYSGDNAIYTYVGPNDGVYCTNPFSVCWQGSYSYNKPSGFDSIYVSYWTRVNVINPSLAPVQWKQWRLNDWGGHTPDVTGEIYAHPRYNFTASNPIRDYGLSNYATLNCPGYTYNSWATNLIDNTPRSPSCQGTQCFYELNYGDGVYAGYSQTTPNIGEWYRVEFYADSSNFDSYDGNFWLTGTRLGQEKLLLTDVSNILTSAQTCSPDMNGPNHDWFYFVMQNYFADNGGTGSSPTRADIFVDDLYLQFGTQARIELCDNSNRDNAIRCELQTPTDWNSGQLSFETNYGGSFNPGETAYLFVIDENNNYNSVGYPVQLGSNDALIMYSSMDSVTSLWQPEVNQGTYSTQGEAIRVPGQISIVPGLFGSATQIGSLGQWDGVFWIPGENIDFADVGQDGGRFDVWIRFDQPYTSIGNKFLIWSPYTASGGREFQLEVTSSDGVDYGMMFDIYGDIYPPVRSRFEKFRVNPNGHPIWEAISPGEWHLYSILWRNNGFDHSDELWYFIDGELVGNDFSGNLAADGVVQHIAFGWAPLVTFDEFYSFDSWDVSGISGNFVDLNWVEGVTLKYPMENAGPLWGQPVTHTNMPEYQWQVQNNQETVSSCDLYVDGSFVQTVNDIHNLEHVRVVPNLPLSNGNHNWQVRCDGGRLVSPTYTFAVNFATPTEPTLYPVTGALDNGASFTVNGALLGTHSSLNSITWWGGSDPSGARYAIENQPTGFFKGTSAQPPNTDYIYSGGLKDQITTADSWSGAKAINLEAVRQVGSPDDLYDNAVSTLSVIYPEFDKVFVSYWAKITVDQWPGSLRLGNKMNRLTKYPLYDGCTGGYDNLRSNREVWAIDWSITPDNSLASAPMTTTYAGWNCFVTETESYTQAVGNGYDVESQVYNRNRPFRGYNSDNVPQDIREKYWFNLDEWVRVDLTWDYGTIGNYDGSQKFTLIRPAGNYPGMWTGSDLSNVIMQVDSPSEANGGCNRCDPGKPNVFSFYNFWQADGYSFDVNYYVDDFYMQVGTQARIELCNDPVYTQSSKCEIQKPISWSDSSVQFEGNFGGSFSSGETAYLFVVTDDGTVTNGVPVVLGVSTVPSPTCFDGIQNQGETGVDCGGPCVAQCVSCSDGATQSCSVNSCPGTQTCSSGVWGSCVDVPNDSCPLVPSAVFVSPTPLDGASVSGDVSVAVGVSGASDLATFSYSWDSFSMNLLDSSVLLAANFNNDVSIGDSSSVVQDISVNNRDGVLQSGASYTSGVHSFGVDLANGGAETVSFGDVNVLSSGVVSASMWLLEPVDQSGGVQQYILAKNNEFFFGYDANKELTIGTWGSNIDAQNCLNPVPNTWYHLYFVWNMNSGSLKIYVNGVLSCQGTTGDTSADGTSPLTLGSNNGLESTEIVVDDLFLFNRELIPSEVQFLYLSSLEKVGASDFSFITVQPSVSSSSHTVSVSISNSLGDSSMISRTFNSGVSSDPYDLDGNSIVDILDLYELILNFGSSTTQGNYVASRDYNSDGKINIQDLVIHLQHWGATPPLLVCNYNGVQDNGETGVDCGGGNCPACVPTAVCNNNILETGEQCDTNQLAGASCTSLGFDGGTLSCSSSCTYDTSSCTTNPPPAGTPSLTGVIGSLTDGSTVTLSGTNFGVHPSLSDVWFLGGTNGFIEQGITGYDFAGGTDLLTAPRTTRIYGGNGIFDHIDNTDSWSGSKSINFEVDVAAGSSYASTFAYKNPTPADEFYVTFWTKNQYHNMPPNSYQVINGITYTFVPQTKYWVLTNDEAPCNGWDALRSNNMRAYVSNGFVESTIPPQIGWPPPGIGAATTWSTGIPVTDAFLYADTVGYTKPSQPYEQEYLDRGTAGAETEKYFPDFGGWNRVELHIKTGTWNNYDGYGRFAVYKPSGVFSGRQIGWEMNNVRFNYDNGLYPSGGLRCEPRLPNSFVWYYYFDNPELTEVDPPHADFFVDDPYIQVGTQARVELCNNQNWNLASSCEVQKPIRWDGDVGEIDIEFNYGGTFSSGQNAWLFVINDDGSVNPIGFPINLGSTSASTDGIQGITSVTKIEQLTGSAATVSTAPVNVYGTDLGSMFTHSDGRIYFLFGDTFGPPGPPSGSVDWRSNTMSYTTDFVASDGITFDGWITDSGGLAKSLVPRGSGEVTKIPTAGWSINGRQYMWFMSVSQWISGGVWTTNYAELAYSDDDGQNWVRSGTQWPGNSNFIQVAFAEHDGYLYVWGIPAGRFGGVKLARVLPQNILDKNAYEYYTGTGWSSGEFDGQIIVAGPVGELSVIWNPYLQRWIMTYLNENTHAIEIRESVNPEGPWSAPWQVARSSDYPQLYGAYMHSQFIENGGKTVYFLMSQYGPYNVFLMKMIFD